MTKPIKTDTGEAVASKVGLEGEAQGWRNLFAAFTTARSAPREDAPSPLSFFGDPEGEAATQRELQARETARVAQGRSPLDVFNED